MGRPELRQAHFHAPHVLLEPEHAAQPMKERLEPVEDLVLLLPVGHRLVLGQES